MHEILTANAMPINTILEVNIASPSGSRRALRPTLGAKIFLRISSLAEDAWPPEDPTSANWR